LGFVIQKRKSLCRFGLIYYRKPDLLHRQPNNGKPVHVRIRLYVVFKIITFSVFWPGIMSYKAHAQSAQSEDGIKMYIYSQSDSIVKPIQGVLAIYNGQNEFPYVSNIDGIILIPSMEDTIELRHPNFERTLIFVPSKTTDTVEIQLKPRQYISVDPDEAMRVFERAVASRKSRNLKLRHISSSSYRKSYTEVEKTARNIPYISGRFYPAETDTGIVYMATSRSDFFTLSDEQASERIIEKNEYGIIKNLGWRESANYLFNPYKRFNYFSEISRRGYLSPFDADFRSYYHVSPQGKFEEEGNEIIVYNIKPKNRFSPFFKGEIMLEKETARIFHLNLSLASDQQIELVDSMAINQFYRLADSGEVAVLLYTSYTFFFNIFKTKGKHFSEQSYKDFQVLHTPPKYTPIALEKFVSDRQEDKRIPMHMSSRERFVVVDDARYKDRWDRGEIADSLQQYYTDRPFQALLIKGMNLPFYNNKHYVRIYPLWFGTGFNTVEGFYTRFIHESNFDFEKESLKNTLDLRLGFADNRLKFRNITEWEFDKYRPGKLTMDVGNYLFQFNEAEPILPVINTFYSLFLGRNFMRLYNKVYGRINYKQEVFNGLTYNVFVEHANRTPLYNYRDPLNFSDASWNPFTGQEYSTNGITHRSPSINSDDGFSSHLAFTIDMDITYQVGQRYKMVDGRKINLPSNFPKFYFQYKKGIPFAGGITDFDYIAGGVGSSTRMGNAGTTRFDLSGGRFINRNNVQFVDFKHFNGLQTIFLQRVRDRFSNIKQFRTLRYYDFSTDRYFIEAHLEHNFGGYLLSKIPYVNRTNLHLITGLNYLSSEFDSHFLELFFGFDNIFKVAKLEFSGGWDDFRVFRFTVRVGINIDYNFYRNNKRR
jgi:hypothetical protein